jgi:hypothetical protein
VIDYRDFNDLRRKYSGLLDSARTLNEVVRLIVLEHTRLTGENERLKAEIERLRAAHRPLTHALAERVS